MSLFADIFPKSEGGPVSSLFSSASKTNAKSIAGSKTDWNASVAAASQAAGDALPEAANGTSKPAAKKQSKRKNKQAGGSAASELPDGAAPSTSKPAASSDAGDRPSKKRKLKDKSAADAQAARTMAGAAAGAVLDASLAADGKGQAVADRSKTARAKQVPKQVEQPEEHAQRPEPSSPPATARLKQPESESGSDSDEEAPSKKSRNKTKRKLTEEERQAQQEKLQRTLFVGNLPAGIKKRVLVKLFTPYGEVESVRLRGMRLQEGIKVNRKTAVRGGMLAEGKAGAHAYVVMAQEACLEPALAANMTLLDGHHIRVDRAAAPKGRSRQGAGGTGTALDPSRSVFVGNLDFAITDEEVIELFNAGEMEGQVEAVRVVRDNMTAIGKGFAFVLFKTKEAARAALVLDGTPGKNKRKLRVTRAKRMAAGGAGPGKPSGRAGGPKGADGRPGGGAPGAARQEGGKKHGGKVEEWQGAVTKGKGKKLRGVRPPPGAKAGPSGGGGKAGKGAMAGKAKRPAVAARKAAALGVQGGGVQKRHGAGRPAGGQQAAAHGAGSGGGTRGMGRGGGRDAGTGGGRDAGRGAGRGGGRGAGRGGGRGAGRGGGRDAGRGGGRGTVRGGGRGRGDGGFRGGKR